MRQAEDTHLTIWCQQGGAPSEPSTRHRSLPVSVATLHHICTLSRRSTCSVACSAPSYPNTAIKGYVYVAASWRGVASRAIIGLSHALPCANLAYARR